MELTSKRMRVIDKQDYAVDLEYNTSYAIVHFPFIHKFTKSTLQDMSNTLIDLVEFTDTVGYEGLWAAVKPEDTFMAKLAKRLDFAMIGHSDGWDVYEYVGEK